MNWQSGEVIMGTWRLDLLILVTGLITACSPPTGAEDLPRNTEIQLFEPVFTEGKLVVGPVLSGCEPWDPDVLPAGDHVYVDLIFSQETAPSSDDLDFVADHGGEVLHTFNIGTVRARLPKEASSSVWAGINHARGVVALDRFDLLLRAEFLGSEDELRQIVESLGGFLGGRPVPSLETIYSIVLPDSEIDDFRTAAGDRLPSLHQPTVFCVT